MPKLTGGRVASANTVLAVARRLKLETGWRMDTKLLANKLSVMFTNGQDYQSFDDLLN